MQGTAAAGQSFVSLTRTSLDQVDRLLDKVGPLAPGEQIPEWAKQTMRRIVESGKR